MIWKLPHPIRGMIAFFLVFAVGSVLGGFGIGMPELVVLVLLSSGAFVLVATRTSDERDSTA